MAPIFRLHRDSSGLLVESGDPPTEQLGLRAHLPQRHEGVPWLERSGRDLGEERCVEHRALAAHDGGGGEQAGHACPAEPPAEDQRAAAGRLDPQHHGLLTWHVAPASAMILPPASTICADATMVVLPGCTDLAGALERAPAQHGRPQEPYVQLTRDVADRRRQQRVDGAAHGGVQQSREDATVDDPERVEVVLPQLESERDPARLSLVGLDAQRPHRRRQGQGARADGVQHGEAVLGDAGEAGGLLVLPAVGPLSGVKRHGCLPTSSAATRRRQGSLLVGRRQGLAQRLASADGEPEVGGDGEDRVGGREEDLEPELVGAGHHPEEEQAAHGVERRVPDRHQRPSTSAGHEEQGHDHAEADVADGPEDPSEVATQHQRQVPEGADDGPEQPGDQEAVSAQQDRGGVRHPAGLLAEADEDQHRHEGDRHLGPVGELVGGGPAVRPIRG